MPPTNHPPRRITRREWEAIVNALNATLAGPLDGFDEGSDEEQEEIEARESALYKVQERLR